MRWRLSGNNWEGRSWESPPSIQALAIGLDSLYPTKHKTDGTVASQKHDKTSPRSDHRPKPYTGHGIVRALDCGVSSMSEGMTLLEPLRLSRDPRVRYVIFSSSIFSSYPKGSYAPYEWRPYIGAAPHNTHIHFSVLASHDSDNKPWVIGEGEPDMSIPVIEHQKALNEAGVTDYENKPLVEDDEYGPRTYSALVKAYKGSGSLQVTTREVVESVKLLGQ